MLVLLSSRAAKDDELSHHHREYEALQCKLQQRLVQVEEELAVQKLQLVNQFDEVSKRQEHEHRVKVVYSSTPQYILVHLSIF